LELSSNLIGEWNLLSVSLGIRIIILNSIGEKIILDFHWFMKDEEAIDWREGFQYFHWTRGTSLRRGQRGLPRKRNVCAFFGTRRRRMSVREKNLFSCVKKCYSWEKHCVQTKSMEGSCV
jgi:hypothetical protein